MSTTSPSLATRLVLLGTGTPNAEADRSGPASAIVSGGRAAGSMAATLSGVSTAAFASSRAIALCGTPIEPA